MKRRDFLINSGTLSAGTYLAGSGLLASCTGGSKSKELAKHVIDNVEFGTVNYHWPRHVGRNARIGIHGQYHKDKFVKLYTNQGATGWGIGPKGEPDTEGLSRSIVGKTVDQLIVPSQGLVKEVDRAFDIALHDLAGIILNQPVYKMLGEAGPKDTEIYSGMIYFDELDPEDNPAGIEKVMENCRWDYEYGYRQLKVKIGRSGRWYPHDEGLAMDIRIVKMIYEEFGDEVGILVDANDMYSVQDTIDFLKGVEGVPLYWMEEPFPENLEEGRKLKEWMMVNGREDTRYADGERNPDLDVCLQLAREKKLDVLLPDVRGYGFTPIPGVNWVNMHGQDNQDALDVENLTRLQLDYRREIWESVQNIQQTPGYEEVFLLDTASQLGIRMSRIVEAEYRLTLEDTMTYRSFDDAVGISGAWTTILYKGNRISRDVRPLWQIPYRSLIPKKTENLLVAGRCFCFERELVEDTRIIGTCLITGHGAGAAAGLAVKEGEMVRNLDRDKLKGLLLQQGAWLG